MEIIATLVLSIIGGLLANIMTPYLPRLPTLFRSGYRSFRADVIRAQLFYFRTLYGDRFYAYRSIRKEVSEALLLWLLSLVLMLYYSNSDQSPRFVLWAASGCFGYGGTGLIMIRSMLHKMVFFDVIISELEKKLEKYES